MFTGPLVNAAALASPGAGGAVHLGALPMPRGTRYVGIGIGAGYLGFRPAAAPVVEAGTALGDRFAVIGLVGAELGWQVEVPVHLAGRWLAVDRPSARVAVTLAQTVVPPVRELERPLELHTTPGIAVDVGGERVRFDAAVPIWGVSSFGPTFGLERFPVPLLSTLGVDVLVGDDPGRHRVRVGWPELVSYHYRGEQVYVDVGGGTVLVAGSAFFKVGALF